MSLFTFFVVRHRQILPTSSFDQVIRNKVFSLFSITFARQPQPILRLSLKLVISAHNSDNQPIEVHYATTFRPFVIVLQPPRALDLPLGLHTCKRAKIIKIFQLT